MAARVPESVIDAQRRQQAIQDALASLPAPQARAVTLFYQGFSHQEIAATLRCSAEAARKQVSRGTAALAKLLHPINSQ